MSRLEECQSLQDNLCMVGNYLNIAEVSKFGTCTLKSLMIYCWKIIIVNLLKYNGSVYVFG